MERSLPPVEIGVSRPGKKVYLWFWLLSVHEAGSGEVFSLPVVHLDVQCYSSQLSRGSDGTHQATDAPAPEVAGFTQVPWDHPTWISRNRPKPGHDMFTDSSHVTNEDELTSIVSCIRQGGDIDSLVTIEVQQP